MDMAGGAFEGLVPRQFDIPMPPKRKTKAEAAFETLRAQFEFFKRNLPENFEAGVTIPGLLQSEGFVCSRISYDNPHIIIVRGHRKDGSPARLLVHVSQLNVLFYSYDASALDAPREPFGFQPPKKTGKETNAASALDD
jgi:hypothetical protein